MRDNPHQKNNAASVAKIVVGAVVVLILVLAAFGTGVGIGVGQARQIASSAEAAAPAVGFSQLEPAPDGVERVPATEQLSAEQAAAPSVTPAPARSTPGSAATPAVTASPTVPLPTPTRQDKSQLPDEAPIDQALLDEAWQLLKEQFYGNLPTGEDVTYAAIRGIIAALGDKHTGFLDPEQAEQFNESIEGQFEGIGAGVDTAEGGGVRIEHLYPDQPAQKAGLEPGDVIVKVDGRDVTIIELNDAVALIRGPKGTKVTLTVKREGEATFDLTVTRARIEIPVITTKTVGDGKIEYISLADFSSVSAQRMQEAMQAAVNKKPQGIILDLRYNPGGLLDASVRIGSMFVPEGNIVIERFADGREQEHRRQGRYLLNNIPLVVLINGGSASASEIVAGAIQDAGTGVLMGTQTYGKGSVQLPNSMSDGSQLRVTIARWYTPKDRGIDGTGLAPDIPVDDPTPEQIEADEDPQLDRAVEYLLTGK